MNDSRLIFRPIVPVYDLLNHLLSFGMDIRWRKRAARGVAGRVLDLACGTGDLAIELSKTSRVFGSDILPEMLAKARTKTRVSKTKIPLVASRGEALPFRTASFDAVTNAFGIRNFSDRGSGLREAARVLRPGGKLVILEFAIPSNRIFRALYLFYFLRVLPFIGRIISGNTVSYSYLPDSVLKFPSPADFAREITSAGFGDVTIQNLTMGIVRIYSASRA